MAVLSAMDTKNVARYPHRRVRLCHQKTHNGCQRKFSWTVCDNLVLYTLSRAWCRC